MQKQIVEDYPFDYLASQTIGVLRPTNEDLLGIELSANDYLKGQDGEEIIRLTGKFKKPVTLIGLDNLKEPKDGNDVILTLDLDIQRIAEEALDKAVKSVSANAGIVLIGDVETGEILALAIRPKFDPNLSDRNYNVEYARNRAVSDAFEPGSIFKIFTSAIAIELGLFSPSSKIDCGKKPYKTSFSGKPIREWNEKYYGVISMADALMMSSNVAFAIIGSKIGKNKFYNYCKYLGFGNLTGIELPLEINGSFPGPAEWSKRSLLVKSIGQELSVTPIQLLTASFVIANDGWLIKPKIIKSVISPSGKIIYEMKVDTVRKVFKAKTTELVRKMMERVVESDSGTGKLARISGIKVAGKTGTAQKAIKGLGYVEGKYVASFIGFIPSDKPKLSILIMIDEPKSNYYGGLISASVFKEIATNLLGVPYFKFKNVESSLKTLAEYDNWGKIHIPQLKGILPDLRGSSFKKAKLILSDKSLNTYFYGYGRIIDQIPAPGTDLKLCSKIYLYGEKD